MKNINKLLAPKEQCSHAIAQRAAPRAIAEKMRSLLDMRHSGLEIILESSQDKRLIWMQQVKECWDGTDYAGFFFAAAVSGVVGNKPDKAIDLAVGKSLQAIYQSPPTRG